MAIEAPTASSPPASLSGPAMRICAIAAILRGDGGFEVYDGYYMTLRNILGQQLPRISPVCATSASSAPWGGAWGHGEITFRVHEAQTS